MPGWFRAVAVDFDGTLVHGDRPPEDAVLSAVGACRREGCRVVLVTGRILEELRAVFPSADDWFDAIVAENGATLSIDGSERVLAAPVEVELDQTLIERGVPFRRGRVLLATRAEHEGEIQEELRRLGLECSLIRNRAELMVLPPGISKGFGASQAFADLGISHHSAIGIGDAENDHSLLRTCELGVAVANAVSSLQRQADLVLPESAGEAVAEFLRGPVMRGEQRVEPRRWQLELGRGADGAQIRIPASQVNVLVVGRSGSGKSYVAGMLAEQLISLGYSLCIVDPEGDYAPLGSLRSMLTLGGREPLPDPREVQRFIQRRFGSVLLDLSMTDHAARERYVPPLLARLEAERKSTGLPHWILLDEAHHLWPREEDVFSSRGYCLVTYRPHDLPQAFADSIDVILGLPGGKQPAATERDPLEALEEKWGLDPSTWRHLSDGQLLLARPKLGHDFTAVRVRARATRHVRHWHKYFESHLPASLHFVFRNESGEPKQVAANVSEFHRCLVGCESEVIRHHVRGKDLSRWMRQALQDVALGRRARKLEEEFLEGTQREENLDALRLALIRAIEERYVDHGSAEPKPGS